MLLGVALQGRATLSPAFNGEIPDLRPLSEKAAQIQNNNGNQDEGNGGEEQLARAGAGSFPLSGHQTKSIGKQNARGDK